MGQNAGVGTVFAGTLTFCELSNIVSYKGWVKYRKHGGSNLSECYSQLQFRQYQFRYCSSDILGGKLNYSRQSCSEWYVYCVTV